MTAGQESVCSCNTMTAFVVSLLAASVLMELLVERTHGSRMLLQKGVLEEQVVPSSSHIGAARPAPRLRVASRPVGGLRPAPGPGDDSHFPTTLAPATDVSLTPAAVQLLGDACLRELQYTRQRFSGHVPEWQTRVRTLKIEPGEYMVDMGWKHAAFPGLYSVCEHARGTAVLAPHGIEQAKTWFARQREANVTIMCTDQSDTTKAGEGEAIVFNPTLLRQALLEYHGNAKLLSLSGDFSVIPTRSRSNKGQVLVLPLSKSLSAASQAPTDKAPWKPVLESGLVGGWWQMNAIARHTVLHALPIGISAESAPALHALRERLRGATPPPKDVGILVNLGRRSPYHTIREDLERRARGWPFATVVSPQALSSQCAGELGVGGARKRALQEVFYNLLLRSRFVASPPGWGWDCYRTWEALYLGVVPVLLRSHTPLDEAYEGLPVLFVDRYEDVTEELLESTWRRFGNESARFDFARLRVKYWASMIRSV